MLSLCLNVMHPIIAYTTNMTISSIPFRWGRAKNVSWKVSNALWRSEKFFFGFVSHQILLSQNGAKWFFRTAKAKVHSGRNAFQKQKRYSCCDPYRTSKTVLACCSVILFVWQELVVSREIFLDTLLQQSWRWDVCGRWNLPPLREWTTLDMALIAVQEHVSYDIIQSTAILLCHQCKDNFCLQMEPENGQCSITAHS